jgi:hypothetical protein
MYRNYETRVKDFVLDMTNPHSMIEHKDVTEKVLNTRAELMSENYSKYPEKRKPLVFRGYISEADRIKDTIKNHKYLYYLPDYEKIKNERKKVKNSPSPPPTKNVKSSSSDKIEISEKNKMINKNYIISSPVHTTNLNLESYMNKSSSSNNKNKKLLIYQPTMRYKPRTDLERVFDVLNGYHCDEKPKDVIERQLKSINLYDYKKPAVSLIKDENDDMKKNINSRILISRSVRNGKRKKKFDLYKVNKVYFNPKQENYKPWQRREDLNNEAYSLLSSYHYKTHFKAAEEIAESNYKYDKNNKVKNSVFLLPNLLPKLYKPKTIKTEGDSEEKEDPFKFGEDIYSSDESEDYEEFDKNYNPIIQKSKIASDPETMRILTNIAFKRKKSGLDNFDFKTDDDEGNKNIKNIKNKKNKNYTEDNNVIIKNKLYYKNTQFDKITSEILEMCKVYSTKSKFNNTVHKSKGGKTMITQGMTVGEFEKKYRLQE